MNTSETAGRVVPQFESLVGESGVHIRDPVEDTQALLYTDCRVSPTPAPTNDFVYPVDTAVAVTLTRLQTPFLIDIWVRDMEGDLVTEMGPNRDAQTLPRDDYILEFAGLGIKIYGLVDDTGFRVVPESDTISIVFDPDTTLRLGARSVHSQPARTLPTTRDPDDLMAAISLFGNAMKTWSPERTWPSLRGHPPLLEFASDSAIPDQLTPPETGVRMTVPPEHAWVYPSAPVAYWFGATVESGSPALHVDGQTYALGRSGGYDGETARDAFEAHLRDVLQFTFLLDCAVRTEGFYDVTLDARQQVEAADLGLEYESLYEASLATRLQRYLDLDHSLADLATRIERPGWKLTADVQPTPDRATILPFLAYDLAVVRCPDQDVLATESRYETVDDFLTADMPTSITAMDSDGATATRTSSSTTSTPSAEPDQVISLPDAESMSQAWVGDGFAVGAAKATTTSYLQRLETRAEGSARITIDVVVNDEEMLSEASVSDIYGSRDLLDFEVRIHDNLTTNQLAAVFESSTDLVHYIGHVDAEGFDCADGYLDAAELGTVEADTFLLNACASYDQGRKLVDRGAIAGVVTLEDIINSVATTVGKTFARLLNYGFSIGNATNLIQRTMLTGSHYVVAGDANAVIAQPNGPIPTVAYVEPRSDGMFTVRMRTFASWNYEVGSMYQPYLAGCSCHYVVPGELDSWTVSESALDEFLDLSTFPVITGHRFCWSDAVSADDLRDFVDSN